MKLCECGCGNPAPIAKRTDAFWGAVKGQPRRFIKGHLAFETRSGFSKGKQPNFDKRLKLSRAKRKEVVVSPFIPETILRFHKSMNRWIAQRPYTSGPRQVAHAKAVWEFFNGPVPEGYCVHHKSGDASTIESDALENLMLLTDEWNLWFMPYLARGFRISESQVTRAYLQIENLPYEQRFKEVCKLLYEGAK